MCHLLFSLFPKGGSAMSEENAKKEKKTVDKIIYLQFAGNEVSLDEGEAAIKETMFP